MVAKLVVAGMFCLLLGATAAAGDEPAPVLVYATLEWEGKYRSEDVAGGVRQTPTRGAIFNIRTDGTQRVEVVDLGGNTTGPKFSPGGQWLYFQSNVSGHSQVYRCRADGSDVLNLSDLHSLGAAWRDAYGCALSGDGTKLAYTVHDGNSGRVVVCDADGTAARFVAADLGYIYMASLNHAGDCVVFSGPARDYRLMLSDHPFTTARLLTPDHSESFAPQFTPDGRQVVFLRRDGDIYSVDVENGQVRQLTRGNKYGELHLSDEDRHGSTDGPALSANGKRIAYIACKAGIPQVCTMNLDGSGQRQLTERKTPCARVRWSPDSRQLAFVSFEEDRPQVFVLEIAAGPPRKLTSGPAVYWLDWQPARGP